MKRLLPSSLVAALVVVLQGCATPQAALDQGNATAALAARFDAELAAYRKAAARVAASRLARIRTQEVLIADLAEINAWNLRTARLAGLGAAEDRRQALVELAESRESDEAATRQRLAELGAQLASVVRPLPSTSAKLAALQKALADMGTELSAAERLNLALGAVQTVVEGVKKNSEAAAAIEAKETAPPAPSSPAPKEQKP